jgi:hypothetical protein
MTITTRPSRTGPSLLGGSIDVPVNPCRHEAPRSATPWTGEPGTVGSVALVGAGKMGLPLAAQFAGHGWQVTAVDVNQAVVDAINEGRSHVGEEPGLVEAVADVHASGRLTATTDGTAAARSADVVVIIVPVMLDDRHQPDYRYMDAAAATVAPGLHDGSLVIFETTLPVGDTRSRYVPRLEAASGLHVEENLFVAFSPERLLSGHVFQNLATYPKLVGGIGRRPPPCRGVLRLRARCRGRGHEQRRGRRIRQTRRDDLPRRQHRARQRVRQLRAAGRGGHPRGHRGG